MTALDGAVVLVAGASGGPGVRVAAMLEDAGAVVVRAARRPDSLSGPGAYLADLRAPSGGAALVRSALDEHGRLDGVVVAAGVVAFGAAKDLDDDTLDELVATNAPGPIRLLRGAHPAPAPSAAAGRKPFVVTISGVVSEAPTVGMAAYSASKAALAAFVSAAGREYRRDGIRVLDARPGHTDTGLATRAVAGPAPAVGAARGPGAGAERIVRAIVDGEKDLPGSAFSS
ncbi:SDR family NAD(P)-dependent oxidoreductase [Frigoribacterium sp. RIT-PI-h]|uniref:SDR family NAD(P)-dependent oxidoreductase n=1 Tax=Frigoribacterium sp. RIT-PI-h TaxID=1690245 RepID=UPI0006B97D8E|nr:SDR family NAD(P)-dependent oxidoreductase [Frigoribacterium sp. RIT-PI-h]KPG75041.1 hypothetical protein AEQ27_16085 [Frigoribacterium sp. RIT-PI-h]